MPAVLHWTNTYDGHGKACLAFFCEQNGQNLPVDTWGKQHVLLPESDHPAGIGVLYMLRDQGHAWEIQDKKSLAISGEGIASLDSRDLSKLGLPAPSPLRLTINTEGLLASPNFKVRYVFLYPDSMPAFGANRNGVFIEAGKRCWILTEPAFSLVNLIEDYAKAPIVDVDERFQWWSRVQNLISADVDVTSTFLTRANIVRAERFTLDIEERKGDIVVTPRFILLEDQLGQEDLDIDEYHDLLPTETQSFFNKRFCKDVRVKARYSLQNDWFVVLAPAVRKALKAVHDVNSKPTAAKREFIHNPQAAFAQIFGEEFDEETVDQVFVETKQFYSDRIKHFGVWQPKAGLYIQQEGQEWFPGEEISGEVGIQLSDGIYNLDPKKLPALAEAMTYSLQKGENRCKFEGVDYPIDPSDLQEIERAGQQFIPPEKPKPKNNKGKAEVKEVEEVPIIWDHIDELGVELTADYTRTYVDVDSPLLPNYKLQAHQDEGVAWLRTAWINGHPGCLLADDMGLGKTLQALTHLAWVKEQMNQKQCKQRPFLIVAPAGLLKNWVEEIQKFFPPGTFGLLFSAYGSSFSRMSHGDRVKQLKQAGIVTTTYESLSQKIRCFVALEWSVVVFDETQKIKNPKSKMTDMAKSLKAEFTICMTGTPVENSLSDLWCIVDTAWPGCFGTLRQFKKDFMSDGAPTQDDLKRLKTQLEKPPEAPLLLRRSKDEHWKEKPKKKEKVYAQHMPERQKLAYDRVVQAARVLAQDKGSKLRFLHNLRFVSLHPYIRQSQNDNDQDYINNSARLQVLFDILDDVYESNEKALVFIEFKDMQKALVDIVLRRYGCAEAPYINGEVPGSRRQQLVNQFQDAKGFRVMFLSPKAGGVGLNLTAATHVVHLSRWWNPAVEDQCSDRAYRIGQKRNVTIHYPMAIHPDFGEEQSFDAKINNLLERKRFLSRTLLAVPAGTEQDFEELFKDTVGTASNDLSEIDLNKIDQLSPTDFELWLANLLNDEGYKARRTPTSHDRGADIVARRDGLSLIAQCKHTKSKNKIGKAAVEELYQVQEAYPDYQNPMLMLVTNSQGFTTDAEEAARAGQIILIDRYKLGKIVAFLNKIY